MRPEHSPSLDFAIDIYSKQGRIYLGKLLTVKGMVIYWRHHLHRRRTFRFVMGTSDVVDALAIFVTESVKSTQKTS
jgi:hypothetical protein